MIPILFFNWDKVSRKNFVEIDKTLKELYTKPHFYQDYKGNSFLLQPGKLWIQKPNLFEVVELYQIAATRNHFNYWLNGYKGAYLDFCGIDPQKLKYNRLLEIDEKNRLIYLKHEI